MELSAIDALCCLNGPSRQQIVHAETFVEIRRKAQRQKHFRHWQCVVGRGIASLGFLVVFISSCVNYFLVDAKQIRNVWRRCKLPVAIACIFLSIIVFIIIFHVHPDATLPTSVGVVSR